MAKVEVKVKTLNQILRVRIFFLSHIILYSFCLLTDHKPFWQGILYFFEFPELLLLNCVLGICSRLFLTSFFMGRRDQGSQCFVFLYFLQVPQSLFTMVPSEGLVQCGRAQGSEVSPMQQAHLPWF